MITHSGSALPTSLPNRIRHHTLAWGLLLALGLVPITARGDIAPDLISEDFSGGVLPATMEISGPSILFSGGAAVFNGPTFFQRTYLRTVGDDLFGRSFVAEVTVSMGSDIAFFGMGSGNLATGSFEPTGPSIHLRIHPTGVSGAIMHWAEVAVPNGPFQNIAGFGNPGSGVHRLRLTWNADTQTAVFEVDEDYAGGAFVADFTSPPIDGSDNNLNDSSTRLFFGGSAHTFGGPSIAVAFDEFVAMVESADSAPSADAGIAFSVNEGQAGVMLDGSGSTDPDGDPLTYAWVQLAGTPVLLSDDTAAQPTFTAPLVTLGGETLTFELTVTANGESDSDTVDVTVVNVNHPPVADAGADQSVAEGSPVTLHGEDSFDIDDDPFTYAWVQVGGSPAVVLLGADTANPTFTAPVIGGGGAPGVVATLVFQLTVDDGFPFDAPAPGYTFADVQDTVVVEITNLNNDPTADAGSDQTVDEFTAVVLNGAGSSDPDSDPLTYLWEQIGGPAVIDLMGDLTATPSFTVPFVDPGGADVTFRLTVNDGFGGTASDEVVVHVQNENDPPLVSAAEPTIGLLWPPSHKLTLVGIVGVSDPDSNATITIDAVTQDEPTQGTGDGDTAIDAIIHPDGTVLLRAERSGNGDGRVYHIHFTASDPEGSASGVVTVTVPKQKQDAAVDGGELHDSTQ